MRATRLLASASAVLVTVATLTVPSMALAADTPEDRIVLQPAPAEADEPADSAAKPVSDQAPDESKARAKDHPPIARASVISDLREAAKCASGTGRSWVVVNGPGDVRVAGWAQCSGGTWSLDVASGSGHIGGMTLQADDFIGTITIPRQGTATSNVRVRLPWAGSTLPKGTAAAALVLAPAGRELGGTVNVIDSAKAGRITMSGKVLANGTFVLKANGDVLFAGKSVPMSGVYRSGANRTRGGGAQPTWNFSGVGTDVKVPGASFDRPRLTMSHAAPGIQGTGQVTIAQYDLRSPVRIAVLDGTSWNASLLGAKGGVRKDSRLPGLTLRGDQALGSISSVRGRIQWNVRMPMTLQDGKVLMRGNATLIGPDKMRLAPTSGLGDIYGTGKPSAFTVSAGSLVLEGRKATGRLAMGAIGEQLVDLPLGWASVSVLEMTPRFGSGPAATFERSLQYVMTDRTSRVILSGKLPATGPFTLNASGYLGIGTTKVPVQGRYIGAGPRQSAAPGRLLISANTDRTPKRYADLGSGARAERTTFFMSTDGAPATRSLTPRALSTPPVKITSKSNTSSTGGTITLQVNDVNTSGSDDSITLTGTWSYSKNTYTVSVKGTGSAYWEPYPGLEIPVDYISGTITADDTKNITSWSVTVSPAVKWSIGDGMTLTSTFKLSSSCTSDMAKSCPKKEDIPADAFFISGDSGVMNVPTMVGVTIPELSAGGAFMSTGTWARWDAAVKGGAPITIEGPADSTLTMQNASVTLFTGATRDDTNLPPDLEMPDLSDLSASNMNLQACGTFKVVILDINTGNSQGCVGITPKGKALGQSKTGGVTPTGDDTGGVVSPTDSHDPNGDGGGLTLDPSDPPEVNGFAYSDIDPKSTPQKKPVYVKLYNQILPLLPKQNNVTLKIPVPGSLMESFGTGISTTTDLIGTGWFKPKTEEFYADLNIPVDLKAAGATLEDINLSLTRKQNANVDPPTHYYDFVLDATGEVAIQTHHYPFDSQIDLQTGKNNYAEVSLTVIGEANSQTIGDFDDTSLLTEGDFEPPNMSLLDGTFDASQPKNDFADSGFEAGTPPYNFVDNMSFEDSTSMNLISYDAATFDGDTSGNILPNSSFDDTDGVLNGDFEGVEGVATTSGSNIIGWQILSDKYQCYGGQLIDDSGPSGAGAHVAQVFNKNCNGSVISMTTGLTQAVQVAAQSGGSVKVTGWLKSTNSGSPGVGVLIDSPDSSSPGDVSKIYYLTPNTWTPFSLTSSPTTTGGPFKVYIQPAPGVTVYVDDVTAGSANTSIGSPGVPNVASPDIITAFDNDVISNYNTGSAYTAGGSGASIASSNSNGYLQTNSCGAWWRFKNNSVGYINGASFDFSTTIYFPSSTGRDIANVGFYMDDNGGLTAKGYIFRLQTSGTDGGFYFTNGTVQNTNNGSYMGRISGAATSTPAVANGGTYKVRLIGMGGQVTANVTDVATGSSIYTETITLPSGASTKGVFGQYPDGTACTSDGQRWDDITLASGASSLFGPVLGDKARTAPGYFKMSGTTSSWGYLMDTGVSSPQNAEKYTYTAWLRSDDGSSVTGNLVMEAVGSSQQTFTQPFTVSGTWTPVSVTGRLSADATSIRVGVAGVSPSTATLLLDDHTFQQVMWEQWAQDSTKLPTIDIVADPDSTETDKAMLLTALNSNAAASYYLSALNQSSVYRVTAKVRAATATPVTGAFRIYDSGTGTPAVADFTVDNSKWVTVTSTALTSTGGTNNARVAIEFPANSSIYVDDVVLTASEVTSSPPQSATTPGVLPNLANWTGDDTPIVVMSPNNAYDDSSYLRINYGKQATTTMSTTVNPGQSYMATVWVKSPFTNSTSNTSAVTATLTSMSSSSTSPIEQASATLNATATYQPLTVVLPITKSAARLSLKLSNGASSQWVAVDYVTVALEGDTLVDPWAISGSVGLVASDDSTLAHSGHGSLRMTAKSSGSLSLDETATPTTTARSFSVWLRSASGSATTAKVSLGQKGGSSVTKSFTVGTTWGLAAVTLPVTKGTQGIFTSTIAVDAAATIDVDDAITRDLSPFVPTDSTITSVVLGKSSGPSNEPSAAAKSAAATSAAGSAQGESEVTPQAMYFLPTPVVTATASGTSVTVSWTVDSSNSTKGFNIYYANGATSLAYVAASSSATKYSYTFKGVAPGTYQYTVVSTGSNSNALGSAGDSNSVIVAAPAPNTLALSQGASSDPNYLMVTTTAAGGVQAPTSLASGSDPIDPGDSFTIRAHLMAAPGTTVSGSMGIKFGSVLGNAVSPQLEEGDSPTFNVDDTWTQVAATFVYNGTSSATTFTPLFNLNGAGTLFIDSVVITPVTIEQAQPWAVTPTGSDITWGVYDDPDSAHDGTLGVLKMTNNGGQAAGLVKSIAASPKQGEVYSGSVWIRSADDTTASVTVKLAATGGTAEEVSKTVTVNGDWQLVSLRLPISNANHNALQMTILSATKGIELHVDDASIVKNAWSIDDTATHTNLVANPSAETDLSGWGNRANGADIKRTDLGSLAGDYGVELIGDDKTKDQFVTYPLTNLKPSTTYMVSAYVWLPEYADVSDLPSGNDLMWAVDYGGSGSIKTTKPDYSKTMVWQRMSISWTTSSAPNANIRFYVPDGGGWFIDNMMVEQTTLLNGYFEGTNVPGSTLSVVGDGDNAYEGSGYAQLYTINSLDVGMYADAVGAQSGTQYLTAYVKSATDDTAAGSLKLSKGCSASQAFTATTEWTKVQVSCSIPNGTSAPLRMEVDLTTPGATINVDSIRLSNESETPISYNDVYGVTTPLEHPEYGYEYLWDDAFGIPGMHLWAFSMQVEIVNEDPGLAVETTVYQDPTKLGRIMYGTEWLKSDLYLEIDELQPCFRFDFLSTDGTSGVQMAGGAIKASDFSIAFAPRGCAIGDYKMPPGASMLFDAQIGDGTVDFALDIEQDAKGQPTLTGDVAVKNINIGGIDYHDMEMSVLISPTDDSVSYVADMTLPMGEFSGQYDMSATTGKSNSMHIDGDVELTDWGWTSKDGTGLKVDVFDFDFVMDVGSNNCGTFSANAKSNAQMDFAMATKINFDGDIAMECGVLTKLDIVFDYTHGSITEDFYLKYDSSALTLSGGVDFDFDRKLSWKAWGHRYHRTANFEVYMDFLMDVTNPQKSFADLGARIHVADGKGTFDCKVTGQPSDSCNFSLTVNSPFIGKVGFSESW